MKPKAKGSKKLSYEDLCVIDLLCRKSLKKFLQSLSPERLKELFTRSKFTTREEPLPKHLRLENLVANQYKEQRLNIDATKSRNLKAAVPISVPQRRGKSVASKSTSEPIGVKTTVKKQLQLTVKSGDIPSSKPVGSFQCEWPGCAIRRGSRDSVRKHMNVHLQTFKCTVCSKCAESAYDLQRHYRHHDNVWPFSCNVCGKAFKEEVILSEHALHLHSGLPPPLACPDCAYSSWKSSHVNIHRVRVHQWKRSNQDAESV